MTSNTDPTPPPKESGWTEYIVFTAITAFASTALTALATWAVDELREKYGKARPEPKKDVPS